MAGMNSRGRSDDADKGGSTRGGLGLSLLLLLFAGRKAAPTDTKPIAASRTRACNKYVTAGFFAIFAIVGIGMVYPLSVKPIARTLDAQSWVETPCKVLRAEVRSHDSDDGTTYSVYVLYQYEFNGRTYTSDRYDFMGWSSSGRKGKARIVAQYQSAANPICYVNPASPSEAVLKRGVHAKLLLALFPLPFLLVGFGGAIHVLRSKQAPDAGSAQPWASQPVSATPTDLTVLRPGDAGRILLTPRHSAKAKFVVFLVITLMWDGILSIFVLGTVRDLWHGDASWFPVLFMFPFVVIGIGLLAYVAYQFLGLFNPRPTLDLSAGTIPLGGAAELRWSFTGQTSRIREFTVTLRGTEEATYRKGTNTSTDKNTFYEMELYKTSNPAEIASGQVGFVVPQDTMHSFEADNNKILWSLDIRGRIERWPDVKESFKIAVMPSVV